MGLMEIGGWGERDAQAQSMMHSTAPAALGDWEQFLIKEGFPSNAQGRNVNKLELPERLQDWFSLFIVIDSTVCL